MSLSREIHIKLCQSYAKKSLNLKGLISKKKARDKHRFEVGFQTFTVGFQTFKSVFKHFKSVFKHFKSAFKHLKGL